MNSCIHCHDKTSNPKFCSRSCSAAHNNIGVRRHGQEHYCNTCNEKLNRPGKYCSNLCQATSKKILANKIIESNELYRWKQIRRYLLEKVGKCFSCGISKWKGVKLPLECDHIDGDGDNNRLSNARLLCPNCHSLTPTYRIKNKNNPKGKEARAKRYKK